MDKLSMIVLALTLSISNPAKAIETISKIEQPTNKFSWRMYPQSISDVENEKLLPISIKNINLKKDEYVILIDKERQIEFIYQQQNKLKFIEANLISTGRGQGEKKKDGDLITPSNIKEKYFTITEIVDTTRWIYKEKFAYGPWGLRLNTGSWDKNGNYFSNKKSSFLLHGTNESRRLGFYASEGCIRHDNETITRIKENYVKIGTKVIIQEKIIFKNYQSILVSYQQ